MSESSLNSLNKDSKNAKPAETSEPSKDTRPKGTVTDCEVVVGNGKLTYRATTDFIILKKDEKPAAEMFFVYYARTGVGAGPNIAPRPITFVFNGGPGASSAYLHVGAVGPRRVAFAADGAALPPPTRLIDNESTWLSFTDLVFIDPIGTGFSRTIDEPTPAGEKAAAKDSKPNKEYYQVKRDLDSIGEFATMFLSKFQLWSKPVFIAGESYGGYRVGKLARSLQEQWGIGLNGAIMISPAIEMASLEGSDYDIQMWSDIFPSLVATAVHHGRSEAFPASAPLESFLPEVERFAVSELVRYLALGAAVPEAERRAIIVRAARYLGVTPQYFEDKGGRISCVHFSRDLLRDQKRTLGLYDGSLTAIDPFPDRETFQGSDPTLSGNNRVFTSGINMQIREALKFTTERDYHLINERVNMDWKNDEQKHVFAAQWGAMDDLRYAMAGNPYMKVFITHGVYDLVTPYFATNRLAAMMRLTAEQMRNMTIRHFKGGHMFYAWEESRLAFRDSMSGFYTEALNPAPQR